MGFTLVLSILRDVDGAELSPSGLKLFFTSDFTGGFAGGLGTLSVPLLTLMIDPLVAAAIMLPILCCMDLFSLAAYRRHCDGTILRSILPAAILGIGLGSLTFAIMSAEYIKLMIGGFALYVATQELYRTVFKKSAAPPKTSSIKASICGFASGTWRKRAISSRHILCPFLQSQ